MDRVDKVDGWMDGTVLWDLRDRGMGMGMVWVWVWAWYGMGA